MTTVTVQDSPSAPVVSRTATPPPPPQPTQSADKLVVDESDAETPSQDKPPETKPGLTGDPDLDSLDSRKGTVVPRDASYSTLAVTAAFRWERYVRVSAEYQHNTNALGRKQAHAT